MVKTGSVPRENNLLYKMYEEENNTRAVVADYLKHRLASCGHVWDNDGRQSNVSINPVQAAMRRLGDEFEKKYSDKFVDMIHTLHITEENASELFSAIMNEIFVDGVNWGRIVALFGFSGRFAIHCFDSDMPEMVDTVVEMVTAYVDNILRHWMETHNYWQGFLDFAAAESESKPESQWPSFKSLCTLAVTGLGVLTLGALLTQKS